MQLPAFNTLCSSFLSMSWETIRGNFQHLIHVHEVMDNAWVWVLIWPNSFNVTAIETVSQMEIWTTFIHCTMYLTPTLVCAHK